MVEKVEKKVEKKEEQKMIINYVNGVINELNGEEVKDADESK